MVAAPFAFAIRALPATQVVTPRLFVAELVRARRRWERWAELPATSARVAFRFLAAGA